MTIRHQGSKIRVMRGESGPEHQETKFEEHTFGHLVENHNPVGFRMLIEKNEGQSSQLRDGFAQYKERLLSLCLDPSVHVSSERGEVIKDFLDEIYEFPDKRISIGDTWVKIDNEKQMVLATYINSLQK